MSSYELEKLLAPKLGAEESRELLSYIKEGKYLEEKLAVLATKRDVELLRKDVAKDNAVLQSDMKTLLSSINATQKSVDTLAEKTSKLPIQILFLVLGVATLIAAIAQLIP